MSKSLTLAALALVFGFSLPATTVAQDKNPPATQQEQKEAPKQEEKKDPKIEAYEKAIKDLPVVEGPFRLYQKKKDLLLEIPEDRLGKVFLVQTTLHTGLDSGLMHGGMPVGGNAVDAFRFDKNEEQLWLVRPNLSHRWNGEDAFAPGAERQYQEAILASYKIEAQHPEKKLLLVNVTKLFYGDVFRLGEMIMQGLGGAFMLDAEKSGPEKVNGYPENTTVQMKLHYMSPRGVAENPFAALLGMSTPNTLEDSRSAPVKVTYSVWFRNEESGYQPRTADPRIGYFTESFFSVDKYLNADRTERYINRWNLKKKNPEAAVSEPVKPIVFTIDNTVPPTYRDAVRSGILRWNKAFENLGFKNAVQVQDQPDDKNYDHADGRYNVVRMMVSPSSLFGAISLFRTDPYTGEILNAAITLDGNMIRDLQDEHLRNQASHSGGRRALDVLMRSQDRHETDDHYLFATAEERAKHELMSKMSGFGWGRDMCSYASELSSSATMAWFAAQGPQLKISKEEYVKRFLADTVSHEVGHALGLRHNFAGSTNLSTTELADDEITSTIGTTGSVMDYMQPNVQAVLKGAGNFYSPVIGPYDVWAIKYGYVDLPGKSTLGERFALSQIASESGKRGHAFMTDEDVDRWNPYAVKFDGASDPLTFSSKMIEALKRAQNHAILNLPKRGESYAKRTVVLMNAYQRMMREGRTAARFIGGIEGSRNFKGDANEKPTLAPVDAKLQRDAAKMITSQFLAPNSFKLPESVLSSMSVDPEDGGWTAPIRDYLAMNQQSLLAMILSANTLDRITENTYKVKNAYGLDEHFRLVTESVFAEIGTGQSVEPLRRDLHRFGMNALITIAGAPSGMVNEDSRLLAADSLRKLNAKVAAQIKATEEMDTMTRVHYRDMGETVTRFLNRK